MAVIIFKDPLICRLFTSNYVNWVRLHETDVMEMNSRRSLRQCISSDATTKPAISEIYIQLHRLGIRLTESLQVLHPCSQLGCRLNIFFRKSQPVQIKNVFMKSRHYRLRVSTVDYVISLLTSCILARGSAQMRFAFFENENCIP